MTCKKVVLSESRREWSSKRYFERAGVCCTLQTARSETSTSSFITYTFK